MMQVKELVQLVGSGNTDAVEAEWMTLLDSDPVKPNSLLPLRDVLKAMVETSRRTQAEALAWTTVEHIASKVGEKEALKVGGAFLVAMGNDCQQMRDQITELYKTTFADVEGLDELIEEAGVQQGRPVRRAIRTMQVCLAVDDGSFLASREEDLAAKIESIDKPGWDFTIETPEGEETFGPVELADQYRPAADDEFVVLKHFNPDKLQSRLDTDPAGFVVEVCRGNENKTDTDVLRDMLVPGVMSETAWKKWWTKARTEMKKLPSLSIEGRSPYYINYTDEEITFEDTFRAEFDKHRNPVDQFELLSAYLAECKSRGEPATPELLTHAYESVKDGAERIKKPKVGQKGVIWAAVKRTGELAGVEDAGEPLKQILTDAEDVHGLFREVRNDALLEASIDSLIEARPNEWKEIVLSLIPHLSLGGCAYAVKKLRDAEQDAASIAEVLQKALADPVAHFDALLWSWSEPRTSEVVKDLPLINILSRIVRALTESRLTDHVSKDRAKEMGQLSRSVLGARNLERYKECLETMDAGLASAFRTQLVRVETLGRAVKEDMVRSLDRAFPPLRDTAEITPLWAREDLILTTREGLAKKQDEIDHHVNVKIRENAKAIGEAAEKGDLSENSEYKFALEERDLLQARLAQMNRDVADARVLTPSEVPTDEVGAGSRIVFEHEGDGARYELTLLGPWDVDTERNIMNYRSPLAQSLMGKAIGDEVELSHGGLEGRFKIVELHNALEDSGSAGGAVQAAGGASSN